MNLIKKSFLIFCFIIFSAFSNEKTNQSDEYILLKNKIKNNFSIIKKNLIYLKVDEDLIYLNNQKKLEELFSQKNVISFDINNLDIHQKDLFWKVSTFIYRNINNDYIYEKINEILKYFHKEITNSIHYFFDENSGQYFLQIKSDNKKRGETGILIADKIIIQNIEKIYILERGAFNYYNFKKLKIFKEKDFLAFEIPNPNNSRKEISIFLNPKIDLKYKFNQHDLKFALINYKLTSYSDDDEYKFIKQFNGDQYFMKKNCYELDCKNLNEIEVYNFMSKLANYKNNFYDKYSSENTELKNEENRDLKNKFEYLSWLPIFFVLISSLVCAVFIINFEKKISNLRLKFFYLIIIIYPFEKLISNVLFHSFLISIIYKFKKKYFSKS
jgi:hypothetical protein